MADFDSDQSDLLVPAAADLAERIRIGGRLVCVGPTRFGPDVAHATVEFLHPVIAGKRAVPARSLVGPEAALLEVVAESPDVVLVVGLSLADPVVRRALEDARRTGLLSIALVGEVSDALVGEVSAEPAAADHLLVAGTSELCRAREHHVTAYHLLWELTQLFLECGEVLPGGLGPAAGSTCTTCADAADPFLITELLPGSMARATGPGGPAEISVALLPVAVGDQVLVHAGEAIARAASPPPVAASTAPAALGALYPFLAEGPADPASEGPPLPGRPSERLVVGAPSRRLVEDARASARAKLAESDALRRATLAELAPAMAACSAEVARRVAAGGTVLTIGNGGSATDAAALADLFLVPPEGPIVAARALSAESAVTSALANDISFADALARHLVAVARPHDVVVALSTSGSSENLLRALEAARRLGVLTVGFAGTDGGRMAHDGVLDHAFVVASRSVHRIQETQVSCYHRLRSAVVEALGSAPAGRALAHRSLDVAS